MYLLSLSTLLLSAVLAHPASFPASEDDSQTWTVTRLDYHYMTEWPGFGPPHTQWPDDRVFMSEISFGVQIPDVQAPGGTWNVTCEGQWKHSVLPDSDFECFAEQGPREDVVFWVGPWHIPGKEVDPSAPTEMPFMLTMGRKPNNLDDTQWLGNVTVSCDDPGSPSSYLTCLTGPPFDGMRCALHSLNNINLSNKEELQVVLQKECVRDVSC